MRRIPSITVHPKQKRPTSCPTSLYQPQARECDSQACYTLLMPAQLEKREREKGRGTCAVMTNRDTAQYDNACINTLKTAVQRLFISSGSDFVGLLPASKKQTNGLHALRSGLYAASRNVRAISSHGTLLFLVFVRSQTAMTKLVSAPSNRLQKARMQRKRSVRGTVV